MSVYKAIAEGLASELRKTWDDVEVACNPGGHAVTVYWRRQGVRVGTLGLISLHADHFLIELGPFRQDWAGRHWVPYDRPDSVARVHALLETAEP